MKSLDFGRCALTSCVAVAMLAACGGSQPPIGAQGAVQQASVTRTGSGLIYIAGEGASYVISYATGKLLGTINSSAIGACSDASGNVFLVEGDKLSEYVHGATTPISTLNFGPSVSGAQGCSVDPTTGNLAATVFNSGRPAIAIWQGFQGNPKVYQDQYGVDYCSYDNEGNLFVDGIAQSGISLSELPAGGNSVTSIAITGALKGNPWQVQWDGSDVALETVNGKNGTIYRLRIAGSDATLVSTKHLLGARHPRASWIHGNTILVPYGPNRNGASKIGIWAYPTGSRVKRVISSKEFGNGLARFNAITISNGAH